jgi:hypothetical protein
MSCAYRWPRRCCCASGASYSSRAPTGEWHTAEDLRLLLPRSTILGSRFLGIFPRLSPLLDSPSQTPPASRACCAASYRLWCCHQRHMRAAITATTTEQQNSASCEGGARSPAALAAASWSKTAFACACVISGWTSTG